MSDTGQEILSLKRFRVRGYGSEIGIFDLSFLTFFKKCLLPIKYTHIYAKFIALIKMIT